MKNASQLHKFILGAGCAMGIAALVPLAFAAGSAEKAKPYPLATCVVSGEKLGGMGEPYVFTHEGREIKLCCKSCLKEFNKAPAKYIKKIEETEAKAKK